MSVCSWNPWFVVVVVVLTVKIPILNFPNLKHPLFGTILYVRIQNMFSYVNSSPEIITTTVGLRVEFTSGLSIYHYQLILSPCWKMWPVTDMSCSEAIFETEGTPEVLNNFFFFPELESVIKSSWISKDWSLLMKRTFPNGLPKTPLLQGPCFL